MKSATFFAICFIAFISTQLSAQKTNVWKGGAPGHENDWHYAKNWSLGATPEVFDLVTIPDVSTTTNRYPIVYTGQIEVESLEIQPGASLTLYRSAGIVTNNFVDKGNCTGCDMRVRLEGSLKSAGTATASH